MTEYTAQDIVDIIRRHAAGAAFYAKPGSGSSVYSNLLKIIEDETGITPTPLKYKLKSPDDPVRPVES